MSNTTNKEVSNYLRYVTNNLILIGEEIDKLEIGNDPEIIIEVNKFTDVCNTLGRICDDIYSKMEQAGFDINEARKEYGDLKDTATLTSHIRNFKLRNLLEE